LFPSPGRGEGLCFGFVSVPFAPVNRPTKNALWRTPKGFSVLPQGKREKRNFSKFSILSWPPGGALGGGGGPRLFFFHGGSPAAGGGRKLEGAKGAGGARWPGGWGETSFFSGPPGGKEGKGKGSKGEKARKEKGGKRKKGNKGAFRLAFRPPPIPGKKTVGCGAPHFYRGRGLSFFFFGGCFVFSGRWGFLGGPCSGGRFLTRGGGPGQKTKKGFEGEGARKQKTGGCEGGRGGAGGLFSGRERKGGGGGGGGGEKRRGTGDWGVRGAGPQGAPFPRGGESGGGGVRRFFFPGGAGGRRALCPQLATLPNTFPSVNNSVSGRA